MSRKDYEPFDLARANFKIHQLEGLEKDNIENSFAGYVTEVLGRINDGKEATVYLCGGADRTLLAAKVFKARHFRHFDTDRNYRNLDKHRDRRLGKSMRKKSAKGKMAFHKSWIRSEWDYLNLLHEIGVRVPKPIAHSDDGVLMEYIGDEHGPAMRLVNTRMSIAEFEHCARLIEQDVEKMLAARIVHGDLSPYNILVQSAQPIIIDVPQAMDMDELPDAHAVMQRDLMNLETFFLKKGVEVSLVEQLYRAGW